MNLEQLAEQIAVRTIEKYERERLFSEIDAPNYPATCDQCGEVGTNATMMLHSCPEPGEPLTLPKLIEWYRSEARRLMLLVQSDLWKDAGDQLIGATIGRSHTLSEVATDLEVMDKTFLRPAKKDSNA